MLRFKLHLLNKVVIARDNKVDILRALAIVCIILAHSQPNSIIFQIRNFDVVLMVMLLGNSFYLSSRNKSLNYLSYIKKRFQRLVIPTWIFLSVFFCFYYLVSLAIGEKFYFSTSRIIHSYFLTEGIGFVWVIKVFFIVALLSPFILQLSKKIESNRQYFLWLVTGYVVYAMLLSVKPYLNGVYQYLDNINRHLDGVLRLVYADIITYGLGYGLIAAFGIRLARLSLKELDYSCALFFITFLVLAYMHHFAPTQAFKYPPRLYYISYGLSVSLLLYRLLDYKPLQKIMDTKFSRFISRTSDWVYFWHILFVYVITLFSDTLPFIAGNLVGRFLFILTSALLVAYIHQQIKVAITVRHNKKKLLILENSKTRQNLQPN